MITSYNRGHLIKYVNGAWVYVDTETTIDIDRPCIKCGKMPTPEGYDACMGHVEGATSACCGHGKEKGYTVLKQGIDNA